jgi:hypothetical protein
MKHKGKGKNEFEMDITSVIEPIWNTKGKGRTNET